MCGEHERNSRIDVAGGEHSAVGGVGDAAGWGREGEAVSGGGRGLVPNQNLSIDTAASPDLLRPSDRKSSESICRLRQVIIWHVSFISHHPEFPLSFFQAIMRHITFIKPSYGVSFSLSYHRRTNFVKQSHDTTISSTHDTVHLFRQAIMRDISFIQPICAIPLASSHHEGNLSVICQPRSSNQKADRIHEHLKQFINASSKLIYRSSNSSTHHKFNNTSTHQARNDWILTSPRREVF